MGAPPYPALGGVHEVIIIYCGLGGAGKTYMLAVETLKARNAKRRVLSNIPIRGCCEFEFNDLVDTLFRDEDMVVIDEGADMLDAYDWQKIPKAVYQLFRMQRHMCMDLVIAVQSIHDIASRLRKLAHEIWWAEPCWFGLGIRLTMYPDPDSIGSPERALGKKYVLKRQFVFRTYDSFDMTLIKDRVDKEFHLWPDNHFVTLRPSITARIRGKLHQLVDRRWAKLCEKASRYRRNIQRWNQSQPQVHCSDDAADRGS